MRILVVDDDEGVRETLRAGLEAHLGVRVETSGGGADLDPAEAAAHDLVVVDMHLGPDRDGLDLIREIASLSPRVRFLVISGRSEVEIASRVVAAARESRVMETLRKPFELEQLFIAVDRALETAPEEDPRGRESVD